MTIQLTVIGLNQIGVSIGLALQSNSQQIERVGSDIDILAEQKAMKLKAFDKVIHNIPAAVENADIVVLSVPVDELRYTLEIICPLLKPSAVILDTSPLNVAVFEMVKHILPEERYLVSFSPSLNPAFLADNDESIDKASPDYFRNGLFVICAPPETHPDAIKLAGDLASLLGGKTYFADPFEADGLIGMTDLLPSLVSVALMRAATNQPGWIEARKLASRNFYGMTDPIVHLNESKKFGQYALLNSDNAARLLDALIGELDDLREMILNQDDETLNQVLQAALNERMAWWKTRQEGTWEKTAESPPLPTAGQMLGRMFGLGRRRKEPGKDQR